MRDERTGEHAGLTLPHGLRAKSGRNIFCTRSTADASLGVGLKSGQSDVLYVPLCTGRS
jgi:hypothetical protein